jgi:hypothetical protein
LLSTFPTDWHVAQTFAQHRHNVLPSTGILPLEPAITACARSVEHAITVRAWESRAPEIPSSLGSKEPDPLRFVFAGSGYIIATTIAC